MAGKLAVNPEGRAFIISTDGAPRGLIKDPGTISQQMKKNHSALREELESKGYLIAGEFNCGGYNTNSFLRLFGGINRGKPDSEDLKRAERFAEELVEEMN